MEDSESVPIGLPARQNDTPVSTGSHTTERTKSYPGPEMGSLCWYRKRHGRIGKGVADREQGRMASK